MTLQRIKKIVYRHCCKMPQYYVLIMSVVLLAFVCTPPAFAVDDIWTVGRSIITDVYQKITRGKLRESLVFSRHSGPPIL